jgi:hypothetical protein
MHTGAKYHRQVSRASRLRTMEVSRKLCENASDAERLDILNHNVHNVNVATLDGEILTWNNSRLIWWLG